jgi:hypothetical protein
MSNALQAFDRGTPIHSQLVGCNIDQGAQDDPQVAPSSVMLDETNGVIK